MLVSASKRTWDCEGDSLKCLTEYECKRGAELAREKKGLRCAADAAHR